MAETEPHDAIKTFVENGGASEWQHKELAAKMYQWSDAISFAIFSPRDETQPALPPMLAAVMPLGVHTLAAYRLTENQNGLKYEVILNDVYADRPDWELFESLAHEIVHLAQEELPGYAKCKRGWHNQQFIDLCEDIGLHPMLGVGAHWRPMDGQVARLAEKIGITKPIHAYGDFEKPEDKNSKEWWFDGDRGGRPKGKSTLKKWICECNPPFKIRTGRSDLTALCKACNSEFRRDS